MADLIRHCYFLDKSTTASEAQLHIDQFEAAHREITHLDKHRWWA